MTNVVPAGAVACTDVFTGDVPVGDGAFGDAVTVSRPELVLGAPVVIGCATVPVVIVTVAALSLHVVLAPCVSPAWKLNVTVPLDPEGVYVSVLPKFGMRYGKAADVMAVPLSLSVPLAGKLVIRN